jgi:hypothetical protein
MYPDRQPSVIGKYVEIISCDEWAINPAKARAAHSMDRIKVNRLSEQAGVKAREEFDLTPWGDRE